MEKVLTECTLLGGPLDGKVITIGDRHQNFRFPVLDKPSSLYGSAGFVPTEDFVYIRVDDNKFGYKGIEKR